MIGRIWHGWTTEENADAYDAVREFAGGERPENFWLVSMTIQPTTM